MVDYFFPIIDNNYYKIISYEALLPNLRYKNNNVYFISKYPIRIKKNNKIDYINEYILENISLTGKIKCINTELNCTILEKEDEDGLIVNIKYRDGPDIYKQDMQKFARVIEAAILGIDLMEDDESEESDAYSNFSNYNNDYSYYANKMYNDNSSNIDILEENYDDNENIDDVFYEENDEYYEEI
jgi:hypothetical protein